MVREDGCAPGAHLGSGQSCLHQDVTAAVQEKRVVVQHPGEGDGELMEKPEARIVAPGEAQVLGTEEHTQHTGWGQGRVLGIQQCVGLPGGVQEGSASLPGGIGIVLDPQDPSGLGLPGQQALDASEGLLRVVVVQHQDPDLGWRLGGRGLGLEHVTPGGRYRRSGEISRRRCTEPGIPGGFSFQV